MILKKFMVHAESETFTLEAVTLQYQAGSLAVSSNPAPSLDKPPGSIRSPSTHTKHFKQSWKMNSDFVACLDSGQEWSEMGISLDFIVPINQVVIAIGSIMRTLKRNPTKIKVRSLDFKIQPNMIDILIATEAQPDTLLRYAWDENSQLLGPQILAGKLSHLPETLVAETYAACFGRLGLLARTMRNAVKEVVPIDDMGSSRWA